MYTKDILFKSDFAVYPSYRTRAYEQNGAAYGMLQLQVVLTYLLTNY